MHLLTCLSLVFTTFLWGGTFVAGRQLAGSVAPEHAAFLRFVIGSAVLLLLLLAKEKRLQLPPPRLWLPLFLLGLTGVFAYNVFFFKGLHYISAGRASLFIASTPLVITLLGAALLLEKLTFAKGCGVITSLMGAVIVISNGHPAELFSGIFGPGEFALIGCVISWSAYSLIGRSVLKSMTPLSSVCYSSIIGTLLLLPPAIHTDLFSRVGSLTPRDWLNLSYLGILGTAVGFSLYYRGIEKIGATRASVFINLVPVFALLLAWVILDESIKPAVLVGGLLVLCGVTIANYRRQ
ncbi:DMT family transporter [Desulforhopalus singaporensis]|uniref:Permease of the drug/metabolite transporter (DMT) superfamily n=1 Tax=Desulforhopalus singaporensis TaxID=91360 RepID=A0A1H0K0V4_9BACT|nr:DMT family transporter [Desulforhopalus singaporensis]SDO49393.1 Permease of the drug/metabolite transporter (DMT) superfamily [Desulforhopalus singaporensis]